MSGIKLDLKGFSKMLEELQRAGGNVNQAAQRAIDESAKIVESELKAACDSSGVPASVSSEIRTKTEGSGNRYSAEIGWELGTYNPQNLSAGYKAIFMNYGTGHRSIRQEKLRAQIGGQFRTLGQNRGQMTALQFIAAGKKASKPKVKKIQKQLLDDVLKELG